jgi:hypothetical protein
MRPRRAVLPTPSLRQRLRLPHRVEGLLVQGNLSRKGPLNDTPCYDRIFRPGRAVVTPKKLTDHRQLRKAFDALDCAMNRWSKKAKLAA